MTKIRFISQNSICYIHLKKRLVAILKKGLGDFCVIITSRAANQSREYSFYIYVTILMFNVVNNNVYILVSKVSFVGLVSFWLVLF